MERHVSPYNKPLILKNVPVFCDVTLREGEQTAGVAFTQAQRKHLVELLDAAHIHQVQLYNTWRGDKVDEAMMAINEELSALPKKTIKTEVLNFNTSDKAKLKQMIDLQAQTHPDIIHASFSLKDASESELTEREHKIQETAYYIASKGIEANISLLDATRAPEKILARMTKAAADAGAARVRLADTVGVAEPGGIQAMCETAVDAIGDGSTILGIHTHNDFGLALADAIAGLKGGATLVDGSLNGLGERCGNASLIEIILTLEGLYGISTGVDLKALKNLAEYAAEMSGIPVAPNAPFMGKYAFSDNLPAHVLLSAKDPFAVEGFLPEEIGQKRIAFLTPKTTLEVLDMLCKRNHIAVTEEQLPSLYQQISKRCSEDHKVVLTEEDLPALAKAANL